MADTMAIRASEEVKVLFNELAEQGEFENKGEFLNRLLVLYQSESAKKDVSIMKPAIETVETLLTRLLEVLSGTAAAITTKDEKHKQQLDEQKKSFEETRSILQQRINELEQDSHQDKERIQSSIEDKELAEQQAVHLYTRIKTLEQAVEDKQALINEYKEKLDVQTSITAEYRQAAEENKTLRQQNAEFTKKIQDMETQVTLQASDRERLKDTLNIEREKALLELKTAHQKEFQEQQDLYNNKITDLLARLEHNQSTTPKTPPSSKNKAPANKKTAANAENTEVSTDHSSPTI